MKVPSKRFQSLGIKKVNSPNIALFVITAVAYLIALLIYSYWNYQYYNNEIMEKIDRELYNRAISLKYILPEDFHDRAIDEQAISIEEDKYIANKLTKLVNETGLKYIYSVIKRGNRLFFIVSDLIADPKSERGTWYYYQYKEADKSFFDAFDQDDPIYKIVSDQWGTVRTVMVPEKSPRGLKYLACADYDISFVNGVLQRNLLRSIVSILLFSLLAVPFLLIYRSIRRKHLDSLQESEKKYRSILESMEEGYFEVDLSGTFTLANESLVKTMGYSKDELLGMNNRSFMDPSTAEKVYKIFNDVYKTGNPQKYLNYDIIRKDGQNRTMEVSTTPRLDNDGISCGFFGVVRDVTEQKKSRELMIQTEKMISLGGLAAGMAHELNNPLGGMLQGVQNIQRRLSPDLKSNLKISDQTGIDLQKLQSYLEKREIFSMLNGIRDSGKKASEIISNMLQFSRKSESQMAPTDLIKIMENVLDLSSKDYNLKKKYDFRNIRIIRQFGTKRPLITCIETEIEQVILNLLSNAAWAMTNDKENISPQIMLRIELEEKRVRIEVEDNGPGMDEETRKHIFEPFFTTKPVGEGTGLGLSVSYMIITSHHKGTMEVESKIGVGTKFIIRLPLNRELVT